RRRQYQYDARRQQGDGGGVFGDNQFTSTLSVNFHFPRIPRRTKKKPTVMQWANHNHITPGVADG
ncbi:hypothetical protein, partial [Aeromonas caviae]|uniref:hypothetical protein n=1 Tax=Aeromonas caviae TaxID=648 RepID=UPI0038CFBFAB